MVMIPQCIEDKPQTCTPCHWMHVTLAGIAIVAVLAFATYAIVQWTRKLDERWTAARKAKLEAQEREAALRRADASPYRGPTPETFWMLRTGLAPHVYISSAALLIAVTVFFTLLNIFR
jgi:hypothetical protein